MSPGGTTALPSPSPAAPPPPRAPVVVPDEHRCVYIKFNGLGTRCSNRKSPQSDQNECISHYRLRVQRAAAAARQEAFRTVWGAHWEGIVQQLNAAVEGAQIMMRMNLGHVYARTVVWRMVDQGEEEAVAIVAVVPQMMEFVARVNVALQRREAADARPELQRIADDRQNTHDRNVRKQTDENVKLLLEISPPADQNTMAEIRAAWTKIYRVPGRGVDERVYADMQKWYDTAQCYVPNDWMYRKVIDGLWARIKLVEDLKVRHELYKRLQQECAESYQMCCEGHIGRLANVLVGFDNTFRPQIPVGIILQQKMAVIAQIENVDERFKQARELMAELNVPQEQAVPWLDAIAE